MKTIIDYKELENFLSYLEDKPDDAYEREVKQEIKRYLYKQVTTINGEKNNKLENFLLYLEDKTDDFYEREVQQAIKRFLDKQVTTVNGEIIKRSEERRVGKECKYQWST